MDKAKYYASEAGIAILLLIFIALYVPLMLVSIITGNNLILKSVNLIRNLDNKAKARYIFAPLLKETIKRANKAIRPLKTTKEILRGQTYNQN